MNPDMLMAYILARVATLEAIETTDVGKENFEEGMKAAFEEILIVIGEKQ